MRVIKVIAMSGSTPISPIFHSKRYTSDEDECRHCGGIIRHEKWCMLENPNVYYAYKIVHEPSFILESDVIRLKSLGVIWSENEDSGYAEEKGTRRKSREGFGP